jgi:hypothetical protein
MKEIHAILRSACAIHEGGTKFYQLVEIQTVDGYCSIHHWGPKKHDHWNLVHSGQTLVQKEDSSFSSAKTKLKAKMKNGYKFEEVPTVKQLTKGEFRNWLNGQIKVRDCREIEKIMGMEYGFGMIKEEEDVTDPDVVAAETKPIDRGPMWGSW